MDPATMTLFRAVANRSSEEREEYYATNQISDKLRTEVESLLEAGDRTVESFAGHLASAAVRALLETPVPTPAPAPPPRPILQPVSIGRYEVKRLLGRGGMSEVYLARDPMLERDIAVKLIGGDLDSDVARRRLVREASAVGRLRHPNIVTIFDAGEHDGQPYIAMEYVPGETLRALVRRREPLPLRRRLELIEGACAGLAHAHGAGVVHLDIKPDNLIVDESGVVKVLDFGIARVLTGEAVATRHIVGTLRYMSPEQVAGDPVDHRSDIFSLGCSLYEMLAYLPAYSGSTREIVYRIAVGPVPRLAEIAPDTDPRLDAAISRAMALEREERFADLDEFRNELARLRELLDPAGERPVQAADERLAEETHAAAMSTASKALKSSRQQQTLPLPRRRAAAIVATAVVLSAAIIGLALWSRGAAVPPPSQVAATPPQQSAPVAPAVVPAPAPAPAPAAAAGPDANEVWKLLNFGDRQGVVRLLSSAPASTGPLPREVLSFVREKMAESRRLATATPGALSSEQYQRAEDRVRVANRLDAREPVKALAELWAATDLYAEALNSARANVPPPVTTAEARTTPEPAATPPPAPSPSPTPAVTPSESLSRPSMPVPAPTPAPAATSAPAPTERAPVATPPRVQTDQDAVLEAIERYEAAYRQRDIGRLRQVYPTLDEKEVKTINETFSNVSEYVIDIRVSGVQFQGTDAATADAVIDRQMTMRTGVRPPVPQTRSQFRLRRDRGQWLITDVDSK